MTENEAIPNTTLNPTVGLPYGTARCRNIELATRICMSNR
jgi:hypothetical protein